MGYALTVGGLIKRATRTHASASRLARPGGLFRRWRERRFATLIDAFMHDLHHVPSHEAVKVTPDEATELHDLLDRIIDDVERFLAARRASTLGERARHQRLATRVYDLRAAFEAIARRTTPNPDVMNLGREIRTQDANQPKR